MTRARALAAAAVAMSLAGCEDDAVIRLPLVLESFGDTCGELPCEWVALGPGAVRVVTTVHPGVHALELAGDGTRAAGTAQLDGLSAGGGFSRGPTVVFEPPPWQAALEVTATGRCAEGSSVDVSVRAQVASASVAGAAVAVVPYEGAVAPAGYAAPAVGALAPGAPEGDPPADDGVVVAAETVALTLRGPGPCELARLLVAGAP